MTTLNVVIVPISMLAIALIGFAVIALTAPKTVDVRPDEGATDLKDGTGKPQTSAIFRATP